MRDDTPSSSAVPDDLYAFTRGMQDVDTEFKLGPAARVRAAVADFIMSRPDYGVGIELLDGSMAAHLDHSRELGAWVDRVATAFFEAGTGRVRRSRVHDPDDPGWDGTAPWTADDSALSRQLRAASPEAQAQRVAAAHLADRVKANAGDLDAVRADMAELDRGGGDVIFATAFFNRLGPGMTLWLERELLSFSHYSRYSGWDHDPFAELLRPLDVALATASRGGGVTPDDHLRAGWIQDFLALKDLRGFDLSNFMQAGAYSSDFLALAGQRVAGFSEMDLAFGGYPTMISERWQGVTATAWGDPLVSVLGAIGRDPEACVRLFADRETANRLLSIAGNPENQLVADMVRAGALGYGGDESQRTTAVFNVFRHFASNDHAPAEIRHVLADLVSAHVDELGLDADIQTGRPSAVNPDGTIYLDLADLNHVLRLATRDEADSARVLDVSATWASQVLTTGPSDHGTIRVGRWYGSLVRANDTRVTDAAASDARRHQFMDSLDKVIGLVPVPAAGELLKAGGEGVKLVVGNVVKGSLGPDQADAAAAGANSFNDDMVARLDYLAAASAFARQPGLLSAGQPAPVLLADGRLTLAPPRLAGQAYQLWLDAYDGYLNRTRAEILAGYASRKPEFAGK